KHEEGAVVAAGRDAGDRPPLKAGEKPLAQRVGMNIDDHQLYPKRGTNPLPVASMWPANGAPTWAGSISASIEAQCSSTMRRLARAAWTSEFLGKFQSG